MMAKPRPSASLKFPAALLAGSLAALSTAGCHSHFIRASVTNDTDHPLRMVEVDYPTASFGVSTLAPHTTYHYQFKALGTGPLQLTYTDAAGLAHPSPGPEVRDNQPGSLTCTIGDHGQVRWQLR